MITKRDKMSNPYRGPSIDASYQVSLDLEKWVQRRRLFLEIDHSETRIACVSHVYMLTTKFQFIWESGLGEKFFFFF